MHNVTIYHTIGYGRLAASADHWVDISSFLLYSFRSNDYFGRQEQTLSLSLGTEDEILAALRRIMHAVELHSRRLVENVGLTGPQLTVLRESARLGRTPIGVLARAVHLSQPTVTGILDRLEKRGLLERSRDEHDRRAVNINITPSGRELLDRAPSLLQDQFRRELDKLQEWEQTLMLSILQRIAAMMEAEKLDASPHLTTGVIDMGAPPASNENAETEP